MNKISALIKLLEDPDEQIFFQIRSEILSMGTLVIPDLEKALHSTSNEDSIERISEILNEIQSENLCRRFKSWIESKDWDLLELMILVEQIRDFNFQKQNLIEPIAKLKMDVWLELNENQTILEQVEAINRIFYEKHAFLPDEKTPYESYNYFIYSVLKTKRGNDTTLGLLYLYIAQIHQISFSGVKLLSNFILAYTGSAEDKTIEEVLFYLNPYKNAALFSVSNLLDFFANAGVELNVSEITPCSNPDIARRWLWFIQQVYIRKGDEEKLMLVNKLLKLFINI